MKIIFLSTENPDNKRLWSGTIYSLYSTLQMKYEVEPIYVPYYKYIRFLFAAISRFIRLFINGKILYTHTKTYSKLLALLLSLQLKRKEYDVIFAPCLSTPIGYMKFEKPIITLEDAFFDDLVNYLEYFSDIAQKNLSTAKRLYKECYINSTAIIYASDWARESAVNRYGMSEKAFMLKFGANFRSLPDKLINEHKKSTVIRILFVGVNWKTKGGPILIQTYNHLKKQGIKVKLTIIGCDPKFDSDDIEVIPFLNKQNDDDIKTFYVKYSEADFFVLPTRFECAGIVFCEASAFGVPILTTDTGGVKSYVEEGVNGYCLPYSAEGSVYAEKIIEIFNDSDLYTKLRKNSREKYEKELNWKSWLNGFDSVISKLPISKDK